MKPQFCTPLLYNWVFFFTNIICDIWKEGHTELRP